MSLSNAVGVIDSDYRGEICVGLCNVGGEPYTIEPNERIAQMVLMPVLRTSLWRRRTTWARRSAVQAASVPPAGKGARR